MAKKQTSEREITRCVWRPSEDEKLVEMLHSRATLAEIEGVLLRTPTALKHRRVVLQRTLGKLPMFRKERRLGWPPDEVERLREMAAAGASVKAIADALGHSVGGVRRRIEMLGIRIAAPAPPPPPPPPRPEPKAKPAKPAPIRAKRSKRREEPPITLEEMLDRRTRMMTGTSTPRYRKCLVPRVDKAQDKQQSKRQTKR